MVWRWLVGTFEIPKQTDELMQVVRVAFFHNENGKAMLAKEFVVRDADGNYPHGAPSILGWLNVPL